MTKEQAIEILTKHNQWRRGSDEVKMFSSTEIGLAIDFAVLSLSSEATIDEIVERKYLKSKISHDALLGNFIGTLEGICAWEIPTELKSKLTEKLNGLKK